MSNPAEPVLEFDHNVIEHLGIRLYQNKPGNVLAEVVANSWDADAKAVHIGTSPDGSPAEDRFISVADDGIGMDLETIKSRYLVIGKPKRSGPKMRSPGGRRPMGRKGIGKLAPFGVARTVDVATVANGMLNWFSLDLDGLLDAGTRGVAYPPRFKALEVSIDQLLPSSTPQDVVDFIERIRASTSRSGTLVRMSNLTSNSDLGDAEIENSLVKKFTVILARDDFQVIINETPFDQERATPEFELRIPSTGYLTESVAGNEVRCWVGFVKSADWSSDQAGVAVYAHGKSAQDRPFFFGAKGKEIFQRYMYGVVEADWIDELDQDLVSTDRSSLDWAHADSAELLEWGRKKVGLWLADYDRHRANNHLRKVKDRASERRQKAEVLTYSSTENDQIDNLVAEATRELGKNQDDVADQLLEAVSMAWVNLPSRTLIKNLWAELEGSDDGSDAFLKITGKLHEHSVPESMGLAVTFAQRAYALSLLTKLVHQRSEVDLQELIEEFPWILQPRGDLLTSDRHLKTTIEHAALTDEKADRAGRLIKGISDKERADFVFLTDPSQKVIQIVELKAPAIELTSEHDRQLRDYLDFTKAFHPSAKLTGLLVGNPGNPPIETDDRRVTIRGWDEIILECRATYVQLLASMLERADPDPADARVQLVREFGGAPVWDLLKKMAETDKSLGELMGRLDHLAN